LSLSPVDQALHTDCHGQPLSCELVRSATATETVYHTSTTATESVTAITTTTNTTATTTATNTVAHATTTDDRRTVLAKYKYEINIYIKINIRDVSPWP